MVALAWVLSRVCIWVFALLGQMKMRALPHPWPSEDHGSWVGVSSYLLNPWTLFDSAHYIGIAQSGYPDSAPWRSVFFPLYSLLMRLLAGPNASDNALALAGFIISNLAFAGALWLLFCLTRDEWGEEVARRAVWIEAFFPAAAFSSAIYTESLFLLLSIAFFWLARQKKWWGSGVCGLLAGLTRNSGPILFLALLLDRPKTPLSPADKRGRFLSALMPLVGFIAVQVVLRLQYHGAINSMALQKSFGRVPSFPLTPLWLDIKSLFVQPDTWLDFVTFPLVVATLGSFALMWVYRRRFSAGKLLFLGAVMLASLALGWEGHPHTTSSLRYLFGTFPAAQLLALFCAEKLPSRRATLYLATAGLMLFFVHTYLFGYKNFMG